MLLVINSKQTELLHSQIKFVVFGLRPQRLHVTLLTYHANPLLPPPTKSRMEKKKVQQGEQKYVYRSRSLLRLTDRCDPRLFQDKTLVSWEEAERGFRDAAVMMTLLRESAPASSHSCRGPPVEKRCHYEIHILTDVKKRERALEFGWNSEPLWALGWIFWWRCFAFRLSSGCVFYLFF